MRHRNTFASRQRLRTYRNNNEVDASIISPETVERFRADLLALTGAEPARLGVAVSGGPDSLALLLLAAAALPGVVEAATVDHGLRAESVSEAEAVADICAKLGVSHAILRIDCLAPPRSNIQARARAARYAELSRWAEACGLSHIATAHHADDQAETILMRLARGSGLPGLAGARPSRRVDADGSAQLCLVRPLLGWRRSQLAELVAAAGLIAADDPSNRDQRFDRTRARALLQGADWLDAVRVSSTARHLAEADEALDWAARTLSAERATHNDEDAVTLAAGDLPPELQRRLLLIALDMFGVAPPPGPKVMQALAWLRAGRRCTLAGLQMTGGDPWILVRAPARLTPPR